MLIYNHGERGATGGAGSPREPCKTPRTRTSPYRAQPPCAVYKWVAQQRDCGGVAGDGVGNPKSFIFNGHGIYPAPVILLFISNEICAPVLLYTFPLTKSMRKIHKTTASFSSYFWLYCLLTDRSLFIIIGLAHFPHFNTLNRERSMIFNTLNRYTLNRERSY